jgi:hypothetical protein
MILAERLEKRNRGYMRHTDIFYSYCTCYGCKMFFDPYGEKEAASRNAPVEQPACEACGK